MSTHFKTFQNFKLFSSWIAFRPDGAAKHAKFPSRTLEGATEPKLTKSLHGSGAKAFKQPALM
jgi:hypothetical protein